MDLDLSPSEFWALTENELLARLAHFNQGRKYDIIRDRELAWMGGISNRELDPRVDNPRRFEEVFPPLKTKAEIEAEKQEAEKKREEAKEAAKKRGLIIV